jgi:predicted nucleotidyltransferase
VVKIRVSGLQFPPWQVPILGSKPIFEELRGLVLKTSDLVDLLRAALAPLAAQIDQAFGYGSVAKGKDTAKSDIDLMVTSKNVAYADLFSALRSRDEPAAALSLDR